jgi:methylenetetrahydrofolate dehydrogenase (NADP+)/methenyltetrahydrofolate cyclohydrolase
MSELLRGSILAQNIEQKVAKRVEKLGKPLGLAVVLVGDDAPSHLYVSLKEAAAKRAGIYVEKNVFASDATQKEIISTIAELNAREDIHGILVQLPLPDHIDEDAVIKAINVKKDVDGFRRENLDLLMNGEPSLAPPVALAVMRLISSTLQPLRNKNAVIVSNNPIFSEPIIALMKEQGIEATYLSPDSDSLQNNLKAADIIVVAIGRSQFITEDMVSEHAILIDVGTNRTEKGLRGDISRAAKKKAAFATPVPGGVGPLTVSYLLLNVLKAHELQSANK